ncbi:MAG: PAS domain S-box protein [Ardenticatenaceae bacterium]|nr:PAS domain S-box protein [Ardenticatenaceae bacterium]MCB9445361.1 PAS domain S-box protein [Ardenticatenaceae bacterium]
MPDNSRFNRLLHTLNPRQSLRAQLALTFGALTIILSILVSAFVERIAQIDLQAASGDELAKLAYYMADAIEQDIFNRYSDLELLSLSTRLADPEIPLTTKQQILDRFYKIYPVYSWVGLTDLSGQVVVSVGERPEGNENIADLPWFIEALHQPYVDDFYTEASNDQSRHLVTIAIPVMAETGQTIGVLSTYLDRAWIEEIETSLFRPSQIRTDVNIAVLTHNGRFLFGENQSPLQARCSDIVATIQEGSNGYQINTLDDDTAYLTGYAHVRPRGDLGGLDWVTLVCQEAGLALAPVRELQQRVLIIGSSLGILFLIIGWIVAARIAFPLAEIAKTANQLQQGNNDVAIPIYPGKNEVSTLSYSLHDLVSNLAQRTNELAAAEQELEETNNTLETIIQSVPLAIFLLDPDGVAHAWNPAAREMFGWHEDDLGAAPSPLHTLQNEPDFRHMLHRTLGGEVLTNVEKQHVRHDGTPMHINIAMAPIHDAQGRPTGAVTVLSDVTERKLAEVQLHEAHRTLAILMSNLPGMAYRRHPEGKHALTFASDGCHDLTGYTREALLYDNAVHFADLIHPDDREAVFAEIERGILTKRPYQCTYRITTASGHERWVWEQGEAVFGEDDTLQALEGFITDNTGQVMARQELEQRVADRTRKLSVLNDVLRLTNQADDQPTLLSNVLQRILIATRGEVGYIHLLNNNDRIIMAAQQGLPSTVAAAVAGLSNEQNETASNWVVAHNTILIIPDIRTDARTSSLAELPPNLNSYIGVPLTDHGKVVGILSLVGSNASQFADEEMDILAAVGRQIGSAIETARLRQQEGHLMVLQERNRLARDLHDSVTQSLYSVVLFAEAGRRKLEANQIDQAATYLGRVNDTSQQALKEMRLFIHKLRPLALQEEGLTRAIQQRLKAVEGRSGIDHEFIVEGNLDLPPRLEETLYHISQEALNNSLKHARAKKVSVRLACNEQQVEMVISDDGRGFEVDTAVSSDGIGLKSMRERVEAFNGTVTLQSEPGQGTTVKIVLPLQSE